MIEDIEKVKVAVSHGDINGIGYEIIIKTFSDNRITDICTPIIYGSAKIAAYYRKALNINAFNANNIKLASEANDKRINIINCIDDSIRVELGKSSEMAGKASFQALERATQDLVAEEVDVLVTAPINKNNIQQAGFNFPGHTEYLASKVTNETPLMIMVSEHMKIGIVSGHVPLRDVADSITFGNVLRKLRILNNSMIQDFGIRKPKIAVLGLNPHASDDGVIGTEENEIITPVINRAREEGIMAVGPYPADGFFGSAAFTKFDAILAMYHDQGLAPFKALYFENSVNYTAGLSIVRTSPAHGTAYELAGQGKANEDSFRQALYLACDIAKNRKVYKELTANPLDVDRDSAMKNDFPDNVVDELPPDEVPDIPEVPDAEV